MQNIDSAGTAKMTDTPQDNRAKLAAIDVKMDWMTDTARQQFDIVAQENKALSHSIDVLELKLEKRFRKLEEAQKIAHPAQVAKRLFFGLTKVMLLVAAVVGGLVPFVRWVWEAMHR